MWNKSFQGKKKDQALPSEATNWQEAAQKKLMQTGSQGAAEKYANHVTKAAMHRRINKKKEGLFNG